ncbi:hypothetical protein [Romboutsia sp. 1001216sp1]|uniref:hypothetical protein n=1 Tax=Romboutsia sp. 1001216sp1 TaxID=2986997 RepID=UPI00232D4D46|nr:hypothetical protein [Romboutsia sp. 1001216sp1]MDB8805037.1 hypothetical protein [Romboutsia sp. 1001216sp1]MDB8808027.1 hypothetical protein [Romboutsia sp. 1001216sp1]MDB8810682.1 hypothetical protein [Romboutsia sp. 1001216sp1]MDB8816402.1 hypothetical protein [Romboutsia sp. 1001216sp1]MDB8818645.1 hypothetical protein [Romboutsia sp. 1001216sp1]
MFKQAIKDSALQPIAPDINLDFWKYQNQKEFNRIIEEDKKTTIQSIFELPKFEAHVRRHEIIWRKHRKDFNTFEIEYLEKTYLEK